MQKLNELFSGGGDGEGANDSFLEDGSEGLCSLSTTQVSPRLSSFVPSSSPFTDSPSIFFLQRMYGFAASLAAGLLLMFLVTINFTYPLPYQ